MSDRLEASLSNPTVRRLIAALAAQPGKTIPPRGSERYAAIAVILRVGTDGEPELLMIKRAEHAGDPWSGHIACPGGRAEPIDRDLEETAVRETREEIGVDIRATGRVLGTLDDLAPRISALPPLVIRPFVAVVEPDVTITLNPEVAAAFWVPFASLRARAMWAPGLVDIRGTSHQVDTFRHGEHTVWGLTEKVLRDLMKRVESGE